ncbi:MAG: hypothetical protein WBA57_23410 [Elainellaceae cyanobacterium]
MTLQGQPHQLLLRSPLHMPKESYKKYKESGVDLERFAIKFFTRPEAEVKDADLVDIFQDWIRLQRLNHVMLDVADYRHVPNGPGVMLVTHEVNYAMDRENGEFGLYAQRKRGDEATAQDKLLGLVKSAAQFGALLESDSRIGGKLKLEGGKFHYISNDRLGAPNTEETFNALKPELEAIATQLYPGKSISVTRLKNDPGARLTAVIEVNEAIDISALTTAA